MKKDKLSPEEIIKSLPSKYYVINLITKKIIQTNDPKIEVGNAICYKQLFKKSLPCENIDGQCICEQIKAKGGKPEFLIEKGNGAKREIFKAQACLMDNDLVLVNYINITNQFKFKKELKINIKRLERAEKLADFGYWEFNVAEKKMIASEGARNIYGVKENVLLLDEMQKIPLEEYRKALDEELKNLVSKRKLYNIKFKIKRPSDGEIRCIHSIAEFRSDKNMVYGVIHDITEASVAQSALQESEHNLNLLFENMQSAFAFHKIVKDKNGKPIDYIFLNVNSKFEELVGKKREEILNKSVLSIFPKTEDYWISRYGKVAITGESVNFSDYSAELDKHFEIAAYSPKKEHFAVTFSDVTSRIKSEKALEDSLKDLKLAQRFAKIGNWQLDPQTNKIKWSEQLVYLFSQNSNQEFSRFSDFKKYLSKKSSKEFEDLIEMAIQKGTSFELQLKINLQENSNHWIEFICRPDKNRGPEGYFLRGTIQDITESKIIEEELNNSNRLLRTVIDIIPDAIYMKDKNFRKLIANKGDARNSGASEIKDLIGKTDYDLYPREIADVYTEDDRRVIENGETISNREEILPSNGETRWVLTSKYPLKNDSDEIVGLVGIGRDITEFKQQQIKLGLLHKTIEQSPLPIVITDNAGIIEYVNPGFTKASGYSFEEAVGKNPRILKSGYQDVNYYKHLWETISSGKNWTGEFHNKRKDGTFYWESAVINPIKNEANEIKHFVAIKEDITEKKQMIKDLQIAKNKAEESNRLKTLFLANMSHEIRTPLNGILGFSSIISSGVTDEEKLQEYGKIIESSGQRLITVIDDIIDISMIQSNQLKLNFETFDINDLMYEMFVIYQNQKRQKLDKIEFSLKYCETEVHKVIHSDKSRVYQVFKNLLDNSFKFTETGFIEFGCLESTQNELILFVKDSGVGIDSSKTKLIFESFRQADEGNARKYDGSGLGLAIISGILEKMNGKIRVDSGLNKGSVFYVNLPRNEFGIEVLQKSVKPVMEEIEPTNQTKNIVSFEDDLASVEYLKIVVDILGFTLVNFVNAKTGIEYLEDHSADLVLMDVQLPEMNGYEATKIIKAKYPELPVIIQTAFAMKGDEEKAFEAGCDDYLSKPLTLNKLKEKIVQFVENK